MIFTTSCIIRFPVYKDAKLLNERLNDSFDGMMLSVTFQTWLKGWCKKKKLSQDIWQGTFKVESDNRLSNQQVARTDSSNGKSTRVESCFDLEGLLLPILLLAVVQIFGTVIVKQILPVCVTVSRRKGGYSWMVLSCLVGLPIATVVL